MVYSALRVVMSTWPLPPGTSLPASLADQDTSVMPSLPPSMSRESVAETSAEPLRSGRVSWNSRDPLTGNGSGPPTAPTVTLIPPRVTALPDCSSFQRRLESLTTRPESSNSVAVSSCFADEAGFPSSEVKSSQLVTPSALRLRLSSSPSRKTRRNRTWPEKSGMIFTAMPAVRTLAMGSSPNPAALLRLAPSTETPSTGK